ncbi:MAG TPA: ABC transporter permease [Myxococcota bacterium]|nr:ABC transporter permease [Myxococcota bacterium]
MTADGIRRFVTNVLAVAYREATVMRHDKAFMAVVTVQPIVMLLLFGYALRNEPANVPWAVLDQSEGAAGRRLVQEIATTRYFLPPRYVRSYDEGRALLERGAVTALVVVPYDFHREVLRGDPQIQVLLDGADPLTAARVGGYIAQVARAFDPEGRAPPAPAEVRAESPTGFGVGPVPLLARFWFNPTLRDSNFFLAALAGMLLTNLCFSASSAGLVGERETGTWEGTLSLPTTPVEIVLGKLLPYVAVCYAVLGIAVLGSGIGFGVWPRGSWLALGWLTLPFVLASLSVGVLISALVNTTGQAVFLTMFIILPSFVLSGVMFPYQLMPDGVRQVGAVLPLRWYQIGLRRLVLRGAGFSEVWVPFCVLALLFAILLALVRWRMKPRLG